MSVASHSCASEPVREWSKIRLAARLTRETPSQRMQREKANDDERLRRAMKTPSRCAGGKTAALLPCHEK